MGSISEGKENKKGSRTPYCAPLKLQLKGSTFLAVHQLGAKGWKSGGGGVVGREERSKEGSG